MRMCWLTLHKIPDEIPPIEIILRAESVSPPENLRDILEQAVRKIHLRLGEISSSKARFRDIVFKKQRLYVIKVLEHFAERRIIQFLWIEGAPGFSEDIAGYWGENNRYYICVSKRVLRSIGKYIFHGISKEEFWAHYNNYLEQSILEMLIVGICMREKAGKLLTKNMRSDIHFAAYLFFPVDVSKFNTITFTIEPKLSPE